MSLLDNYIKFLVDELEGHNLEHDNAGWTRYGLNEKDDHFSREELEEMTPEQAYAIYRQRLEPLFMRLHQEIPFTGTCIILLDTHVLQGDNAVLVVKNYVSSSPHIKTDEEGICKATYRRLDNIQRIVESRPDLVIYQLGWQRRIINLACKVKEWLR